MRVGILGWDRTEDESVGLLTMGRERGHETSLFTLDDIGFRLTSDGPVTVVQGRPVTDFDLILCRPEIRPDRVQGDYERYALLCDVPGVTVLDPVDAYFGVENKLLALRHLANAGLPVVPGVVCSTVGEVTAALDEWGTVVIKPSFGYGGTDVERIDRLPAQKDLVERLFAAYPYLLCQPYFPHPDGDFRITVVGEHAPLNFQRVPAEDGWKANTMQGASVRMAEPPPFLIDIALAATRAVGITVSGLDFVPTPDGYQILEINNTPGWYASEEYLKQKVMTAVYEHAERLPRTR